ncbi:MAG: hypothetical protein BRC51_14600 [Cyanobacteria bacterium SW_12_48_29]|nr:MAG: hypothetical protein BRC51_14600 [Cyanobacteria bacterium SW_12_48_29]
MPLALGIGVGLIYLAFMPPLIWGIDGNAMLEVAESLVIDHDFRVSPRTGALGADGYYYSKWYPLLPVLAVPFVALGIALSEIVNLPAHYTAAVCALTLSPLLTAATTALVALLALRLGSDRRGACLAALSFAFGTIALTYTGYFFAEPLLAFLTVASLYFGLGSTRKEIISASLFAGINLLAKPPGGIVGPILSAYLFFKKRPLATTLLPLVSTIIFVIVYGIYNYMRFGDPLFFGHAWISEVPSQVGSAIIEQQGSSEPAETGQQQEGILEAILLKLSVPAKGIFGLLLSPGGGLLWYCPPVILAFRGFYKALKTKPLEALTIITVFLGLLLIYSGAWWAGGWAWGPRYLLPALPGLFALTALLKKHWRNVLIALTVIGFIVNAPTMVSFYQRYYVEMNEQKISREASLWSLEHAPFRHSWYTASGQIRDALNSNLKDVVDSAGKPEKRGETLRIVSVWWWMLPAVGIPLWVGGLLALLLVGAGIGIISAGAFVK